MELASLVQLDRCHRRHDEVMEQLLAAARRLAAGRPDSGDAASVHDAVAYFERAVPRHFLDEEGSVFPRLSTRRPELADALAQLSAEHPPQIGLQNAIAEAARDLGDDSRPGAGKQLLELAERLAELHHAHVAREDALFGDAAAALSAEDDAEIVAEMETRRERDDDGAAARRQREARPTKAMKPLKKPTATEKPKAAKQAARTPKRAKKPKPAKPARLAKAAKRAKRRVRA